MKRNDLEPLAFIYKIPVRTASFLSMKLSITWHARRFVWSCQHYVYSVVSRKMRSFAMKTQTSERNWRHLKNGDAHVYIIINAHNANEEIKRFRGHPDLNQGPLDLQSNALPLSYIPTTTVICIYNINKFIVA